MNKKVYLCDLDFTRIKTGYKNDGTPDFMVKGGVKATIVFNNTMSYDEFKKIRDNTYFYLTNEDYKSRIVKALEYIENNYLYTQDIDYDYDDNVVLSPPTDELERKELLNILRGKENE